jgi:hypothetical protein
MAKPIEYLTAQSSHGSVMVTVVREEDGRGKQGVEHVRLELADAAVLLMKLAAAVSAVVADAARIDRMLQREGKET